LNDGIQGGTLITQCGDLFHANMRIAGLQIFKTGDLFIHLFTHRGMGALLERFELLFCQLLRLVEHAGQQLVADSFIFNGACRIAGRELGAGEGGIGSEIATLMIHGDTNGRGGQEP